MSCKQIIIYNGLSTSYCHMLVYLAQNAQHMQEHGIGYVNRRRTAFYGIPSHQYLVDYIRQAPSMSANEKAFALMEGLGEEAQNWDTLLLSVFCPWAQTLIDLKKKLCSLPGLEQTQFRILFHVSPQEAVLEHRLRLVPDPFALQPCQEAWFQSDITNLPAMLAQVQDDYGMDNVCLHWGTNDSIGSLFGEDVALTLYNMLQLPPSLPPSLPPIPAPLRYRINLRSREARHVQSLYIQLDNVWPPEVNFLSLLTALENLELTREGKQLLDFRSMASPDDVATLRRLCAAGNAHAATMELATGNFVSPQPQEAPHDTWEPYRVLDHTVASAIVQHLSPAMADGLREALQVGGPILSPSHLTLLAALEDIRPSYVFRPPAPTDVKVSVLMQTYNQKAYIAEALESVLAQKTDFSVEIVVVDDASTDGTQDIVDDYARRYGNIRPVLLRIRNNEGQNTLALFRHVRAPYVAICDGDDYFTDPEKLRLQVEYLEAHPRCALCFHPVRVVWEDGSPTSVYPDLNSLPRGKKEQYYLADLFRSNFIQTNSVMYRWRFAGGIPDWFAPELVPGDWYWHLLHAELGYIGLIDRVMSVYRRHTTSLFWRPQGASSVEHRMRFGVQELRLYRKIQEHFGKRGVGAIEHLITGVFADFIQHSKETGDSTRLDRAVREHPDFAEKVLAKMKAIHHTHANASAKAEI